LADFIKVVVIVKPPQVIKNAPASEGHSAWYAYASHLPEYCRTWHHTQGWLPRFHRAGPSTSLDKSAARAYWLILYHKGFGMARGMHKSCVHKSCWKLINENIESKNSLIEMYNYFDQ
jgi:hypothetical protein